MDKKLWVGIGIVVIILIGAYIAYAHKQSEDAMMQAEQEQGAMMNDHMATSSDTMMATTSDSMMHASSSDAMMQH